MSLKVAFNIQQSYFLKNHFEHSNIITFHVVSGNYNLLLYCGGHASTSHPGGLWVGLPCSVFGALLAFSQLIFFGKKKENKEKLLSLSSPCHKISFVGNFSLWLYCIP